MKSLILVVISLTFSAGPPWETNFDRAQAEAKKSHKQIFLNFSGSDWCAPCIKLKRDVFETEEFNMYASENLILIRADFPRLKKNQLDATQRVHNEKLAEKYNPTGKFPYSLLLDEDGKILKTWDGYSGEPCSQFVKDIDLAKDGK